MPIDASIYSNLQPVAPIATPNPLALIQGAAQVQDIRAQVEQRRLAGEAARQKAQDDAQVRSVFANANGDIDQAIEDLYKVNPRAAGPIAEQVGKSRKETLEAAGKNLDNQKKQLDNHLQVWGLVKDQPSLDAIRPLFVKSFPQLNEALPTEYGDGTAVQAVNDAALSRKDQIETKQKALEFWAKGDTRQSLATLYSRVNPTAPDAAQQWDQIGKSARAMGAKQAELDVFGPYDPSAPARAASLGITPKEQAELDAKAAAERQTVAHQTAEDAATAARDKAAHADRMAALDVARARLNKTAGARPVTSADARRVGEFNSARDDLSVLADTVSTTGATGVAAQVGAALPNWVTDVTGWGTDAKKKQAVIDRVKQVIGKALEGGVLRKEDEIKYTKILPTISDPPAIVQSKLQGVDAMIAQKRQDHLDALADAGYDVAKYTARPTAPPLSERAPGATAAAAVPAPVAAALKTVGPGRHTLSDGSVWDKRPDGSIVKAQ